MMPESESSPRIHLGSGSRGQSELTGLPDWEEMLTPEQRLNLIADLVVEMVSSLPPEH